jgi:hypothetical protein
VGLLVSGVDAMVRWRGRVKVHNLCCLKRYD